MKNNNNYDSIAWCYDWLSFIVFGNSIKIAQIQMLPFIGKKNKVLISGGGTGWILEEIAKLHSSGLTITYIDVSEKMIRRSKNRKVGLNKIEFINKSIEEVVFSTDYYDVILTHFFFDNFSQSSSKNIFEKLHQSLKSGGKWLFSDFQLKERKKFWQRAMINSMYLFFKITCGIQANKLPDTDIYFYSHNYKLISAKSFYNKLIISKVFEKNM